MRYCIGLLRHEMQRKNVGFFVCFFQPFGFDSQIPLEVLINSPLFVAGHKNEVTSDGNSSLKSNN